MDTMFTRLFGPDFCKYECTKPSKASILSPDQINHDVMDIIEVNDNTAKASVSTVSSKGSCNLTNDEDDVTCSVNGEGSCNLTNDKDDVSCSVQKRQFTLGDFQNGRLNSLTHNKATAYYLPKVSFIALGDVTVSKHFIFTFNPLLANGLPSASTVQHAMKLHCTFPSKVVKLGHLGCYNLASLKVFEKMCALESDASNLWQEICWLSQTPEAQNTAGIKDTLINSMLHEVILQYGQSIMDLSDVCTLFVSKCLCVFV